VGPPPLRQLSVRRTLSFGVTAAPTLLLISNGHGEDVVAARLAPIPADAVSCAAGLSAVPPRSFALGVLVGELPWTVAAVVVGNSLSTITARGLGGVGLPLAVATTAAAVLLLAGPAYERFGNRSTGA